LFPVSISYRLAHRTPSLLEIIMNDENTIRAAVQEWGDAFCSKDVERLIALYTLDAVVFDAIPPFSSDIEGMRSKLVDCIRYFPDGFAAETRDLTISVSGELASAHFIWHFTGLPPGHPAGRHWFRSSIVWRRQGDGRWLIAHDHCSAPFDPYTEKVVLSPDAASGEATSCGERNPVGWFEIYVQDMPRAKAFYGAVFNVPFTRLESPIELWAFPMQPNGPGISGALAKIEGCGSGDNSVIVYFTCEDCGVLASKAVEAGGQIHKTKISIGQYGYIALVLDSEGNMIGLHSMQ
jgi:predicted enzyme related to lactoylglutathione lyase/ketosteroid isomerase-like protein